MKPEDYLEQWNMLTQERYRLAEERTSLETELSEINTQISRLSGIIANLGPLAGIAYDATDVSKLGITDAIRAVLKNIDDRLSAAEIRQALDDGKFDMSRFSSPMQSIYKILSRLVEGNQVVREREEERIFFRWIRDNGITDEDIPF